jgi:23S rRNA pseudouridine955/2504/2580 synthase
MFLHAYQITFQHPETGKPMTLQAPLPAECDRFLVSLGHQEVKTRTTHRSTRNEDAPGTCQESNSI